MSSADPPDKGGTSDLCNNNDNSRNVRYNSTYQTAFQESKNLGKDKETRLSGQTATGISVQVAKKFKLDKPNLYSIDKIYVFIEKINNENLGNLHPMSVGHLLHKKLKVQNITKIQKVGRNRVRVEVKTTKDANMLIENENLKEEQLKAFIPNNLIERKGVIKEVDTTFSDEYLLENIESPNAVTSIRRFKRKIDIDGEAVYIPRQTVLVSFEGNVLPPFVIINSVVCPVEKYIQKVVQCYNCLRYGHVAKQCKSSNTLCINCSKKKEENHSCKDPEDTFCFYCKSNDHKTIHKKCPVFEKQKQIKQFMSDNNVTYIEAKNWSDNSYISKISNNRFNVLDNTSESFPLLPKTTIHQYQTNRESNTFKKNTPSEPSTSHSKHTITQTKKRRIQSPNNEITQAPMFPRSFGPSKPVFQFKNNSTNENMEIESMQSNEENDTTFIQTFFQVFKNILEDISSFEELQKVDIQFVTDRLYKMNHNLPKNTNA